MPVPPIGVRGLNWAPALEMNDGRRSRHTRDDRLSAALPSSAPLRRESRTRTPGVTPWLVAYLRHRWPFGPRLVGHFSPVVPHQPLCAINFSSTESKCEQSAPRCITPCKELDDVSNQAAGAEPPIREARQYVARYADMAVATSRCIRERSVLSLNVFAGVAGAGTTLVTTEPAPWST